MAVERVSKRLKQWDQDKKKVVHLMSGYFEEETAPITLNLLGSSTTNSPSSSSSCGLESIESESIEGDMLDSDNCLDLKTGEEYYLNSGATALNSLIYRGKAISTEGEDKRVDLELNLYSTSNALNYSRENSVNSINNDGGSDKYSVAEVESSMRLVGCLACLTYYMVCRRNESCPKCKGSSLLDFLGGDL